MIRLFILLMIFSFTANSQPQQRVEQLATIREVIEGYNQHNYGMMKQPWGLIGKLLVTKRRLKREFGPFYASYGKAVIDTITNTNPYLYTAKLRMERKPSEQVYLQFVFNDRGKVQGMGFGYPPLVYRKANVYAPVDTLTRVRIDTMIRSRYITNKKKPFNGSIAVLNAGEVLYQEHYGYADYDLKTAINDTTLFELASCSKQFTAIAILLLEADHKLSLADTLQRFIPGFPYHNVTIRHLLNHTSGLPNYETLLEKVWDKSRFATNDDVIAQLEKHQPKVKFQPGARFEYSNLGYVLLSCIIERASGQSYGAYLNERIFKPLAMTHTRVYNTRRSAGEHLDNYAYGYVYAEKQKKYLLPDSTGKYRVVVYQDAITGDGTVNSCVHDLIKWEHELLYPKVIPTEILQRAMSDQYLSNGSKINYGYGFMISGGNDSERLVFHTGGWPGYTCILMNFVDTRHQVIVLSNNSYDNFTRIADDITSLMLEKSK